MAEVTLEEKEDAIIDTIIKYCHGIYHTDAKDVCDLIVSGDMPYVSLLPITVVVEETDNAVILRC